jgi:predicted nucleic acid-binding protein
VIPADTSIWVDYLRRGNMEMAKLLRRGQIVMHPFMVAEIALGSLRKRRERLEELEALLELNVAQLGEIRHMIEARPFYAKGIGLIDANLLASCLMTPGTQLWTLDVAMAKVARPRGSWFTLPEPSTMANAGSR